MSTSDGPLRVRARGRDIGPGLRSKIVRWLSTMWCPTGGSLVPLALRKRLILMVVGWSLVTLALSLVSSRHDESEGPPSAKFCCQNLKTIRCEGCRRKMNLRTEVCGVVVGVLVEFGVCSWQSMGICSASLPGDLPIHPTRCLRTPIYILFIEDLACRSSWRTSDWLRLGLLHWEPTRFGPPPLARSPWERSIPPFC